MAEIPSKPRRRFLRVSLRALLAAVTVLGIVLGWIAWNAGVVRHRQRLLEWCNEHDGGFITREFAIELAKRFEKLPDVPLIRRLFGDEAIAVIAFSDPPSADVTAELRNCFPEAAFDYRAPSASSGRGADANDGASLPGRTSVPTTGPAGDSATQP